MEEKQSQLEVMEEENESQQKELEGFIEARKTESSSFALELEEAQARAAQAAGEVIRKTEEIRILRARQEEERIRQEKERIRQEQESAGREPGSAGQASGGAGTAGGRPVKSIGGTEFGRNVADYALQFVGNPYVYGGTTLPAEQTVPVIPVGIPAFRRQHSQDVGGTGGIWQGDTI